MCEGSRMPQRFLWIDSFRGLAALCVVIFHYHHFYLRNALDRTNLPPTESFPYAAILNPIYLNGHLAVQLFWVISGFVFTHVYLTRKTSLWQFSLARIARLYPLHLLSLLIVATLQIVSVASTTHWQIYENNDLRHFGLQLLFASNWTGFSRGLSFNGPIWSVSLEIVAYGLFIVTLPAIRRLGLVGAAMACAGAWMLGAGWVDLPVVQLSAFICAGYFYLGVSVYLLTKRFGQPLWIALAAGLATLLGNSLELHELALAAGCCGVLAGGVWLDLKGVGQFMQRPLVYLGDMSYAIYLVHVPLQMLLLLMADTLWEGTRAFAQTAWLLPAYLIMVLVVSKLTHDRFEMPCKRWILKFR